MLFAALGAYLIAVSVVFFAQPSRWLAHLGCLAGAAVATALLVAQVRSNRLGDPIGMYGGAAVMFLEIDLVVYTLITTALVWPLGTNARRVALIHVALVLVAPLISRLVDKLTQ